MQTLKKAVLFQTFLEGMFDDAYIFDAKKMALLAVSDAVYVHTGKDFTQLATLPLSKLLGFSQKFIDHHMQVASNQADTGAKTKPNVVYVDQFRFIILNVKSGDDDYIVVIKNDASSNESIERVLSETESRFKAIVGNIPGLVCQFRLDEGGDIQFDYLSDHCEGLLGMSAEMLKQDAKIFFDMINVKDRATLRARFKSSRQELVSVNWDGRVWIDEWKDTKWINLRATPNRLDSGDIQWSALITNITQSMDEKLEIEESRRSLSELTAHINSIREDERHKIAREIHDDLGGNLTAIKISLGSLMRSVQTGETITEDNINRIETIVDGTYEAIHRMSRDLRPNIIEFGIVPALEWQTEEFYKQYKIPCNFEVSSHDIATTKEQAMALFRICQESMSNIVKYANASEVDVHLNKLKNEVEMKIVDNGIGIKPIDKIKHNSFGLRGMQERVSALNGRFKISRLRGRRGTQVQVRLPINIG